MLLSKTVIYEEDGSKSCLEEEIEKEKKNGWIVNGYFSQEIEYSPDLVITKRTTKVYYKHK